MLHGNHRPNLQTAGTVQLTGKVLMPDTDISADLNIDSVAVMDFVMEVEDHFDIEIPLNVVSETRSIGDLASVVDARVKKV
jgi:acyl carrier protein